MAFKHIQQQVEPTIISLHDCYCSNIQLVENQVHFFMNEGITILNTNPHNSSGKHFRSDEAMLIFQHNLNDQFDNIAEDMYDITLFKRIFLFRKYLFTISKYLSFAELAEMVNSKKYTLEFISEYKNSGQTSHGYFFTAVLRNNQNNVHQECFIKIRRVEKLEYQWNNLRLDWEVR